MSLGACAELRRSVMIAMGGIVGMHGVVGTMGMGFMAAGMMVAMVMMAVRAMRVFVAVVPLAMMHVVWRGRINGRWRWCPCGGRGRG